MGYVPSFTPQAIAERASWQYRAIAYTQGNKSQTGALLIAVLGRKVAPPCFHVGGMQITADGAVVALYRRTDRSAWTREVIYSKVEDMNVAFRGLAEAISMTDAECVEMFDELRKYVIKDERAVSRLD